VAESCLPEVVCRLKPTDVDSCLHEVVCRLKPTDVDSWLHEALCRLGTELWLTVGYMKLCVDRDLNCG